MSEVVTYPNQVNQVSPTFNLKKIITGTLITGVTGCAIYYFAKKQIQDNRASKSDAKSFQVGTPATIATELNLAITSGTFGVSIENLRKIITGIKSKEELDLVKAEYFKQYKHEFNAELKPKIQLSEYEELVAIASAKPVKGKQIPNEEKYKLWAKRLKAAFDKKWLGVDAVDMYALQAALKEVPTQAAFVNVGKEYARAYGDNIMTVIKDRLRFWEVDTYLKIISDKPKGK